MSSGRSASGARRTGSPPTRMIRAWRELPQERRLAALASVGLFLTLFLPWYQETVVTTASRHASAPTVSVTGWGAFSFVEAAVLLVAVGVMVLLFFRAEGRAFHVPGGDGGVITAAGVWTAILVIWRIFDKEGTSSHNQFLAASGIEWGIFIALGVAVLLAYAGTRIRLAHEPEPPLPGESPDAPPGTPTVRARRRADRASRPRPAPPGSEAPTRPAEVPRRPRRPGERHGDLNFSDLDEIEFDEPPEVPDVPRRSNPDDQLTSRLDKPD